MKKNRRAAAELYAGLRESQRLKYAFEEWQGYRREVTDFLLKYTTPGATVAIFGAGGCNDFDLQRLVKHFAEVTLYDHDAELMQMALERDLLTEGEGLRLRVCDFAGITDEEYIDYAELLIAQEEPAEEALLEKLEMMYDRAARSRLDFGAKLYDYTLVLGVDSQLNNMAEWLRQLVAENQGERLTKRIQQENEVLVRRFHDAVLHVTRKQLFLGCERERLGRSGTVQGAVQAFWDVEDRLNRGELRMRNGLSIYWPFDIARDIIYKMEILNLEKLPRREQCSSRE